MNENILKNSETPYMTREERIMYAKIAIDEALKVKDFQTANHYKILLDMYQQEDDDDITLGYINRLNKK